MNRKKISRHVRKGLIDRARGMRNEPTCAEALLWEKLRKRQLGGLKFRRQHIIHVFIVDFYCPAARLVIEIDGSVHAVQEDYDQEREACLEALGYEVVRFSNEDVEEEIEMVLAGIYDRCMRRSPTPGKRVTKE
jgi:very-short-patch-repair endonuclease